MDIYCTLVLIEFFYIGQANYMPIFSEASLLIGILMYMFFLPWKCWLWLCCVRVEASCWQFPAVFCVPRGGWRNHAAAADECPPFYTPAVCSFRLFLLVGAPCDISWWSNCEKYSPDNTSTIIELLFVNLTRPLKTCQKFCGVGNVRWFF